MPVFSVGTHCVKLAGRKAGQEVTVTKVIDAHFVEIKDAKGKVKRSNVSHLEPL